MTDKQEKAWDCLVEQSGENVARVLTNYHGMQLLTDEFYEYLIEEGFIDEAEQEDDAGVAELEDLSLSQDWWEE